MYSSEVGMNLYGADNLKDPSKGLSFQLRLTNSHFPTLFAVTNFAKNENFLRWNHFTIAYNSTYGVCIYVNGKGDSSLCSAGGQAGSGTSNSMGMRVGWKYDSGGKQEFYLDDFAIWKTWLSAEEVQSVYNYSKL